MFEAGRHVCGVVRGVSCGVCAPVLEGPPLHGGINAVPVVAKGLGGHVSVVAVLVCSVVAVLWHAAGDVAWSS